MTLSNADDGVALSLGERPSGGQWRFFLVDDSEFVLKNLERLLHSMDGAVIGTAKDGEEAVALYPKLQNDIDLVTLDITMPKLNGLETLKRLKQMNPNVKVVMVSALGHEEAIKAAIMLGAKHFIGKPFKRADCHRVFTSVLKAGA